MRSRSDLLLFLVGNSFHMNPVQTFSIIYLVASMHYSINDDKWCSPEALFVIACVFCCSRTLGASVFRCFGKAWNCSICIANPKRCHISILASRDFTYAEREREREMMFRAHLIRLSLSTNESNAQYYTQVFKTTLDLIFSRAGKRLQVWICKKTVLLITRDRSVTGTLYSKEIRCVGCLRRGF